MSSFVLTGSLVIIVLMLSPCRCVLALSLVSSV